MLLPGLSARAAADEIPHENYDLIQSNLDVVIALLNSSILYSEAALGSMYDEQMQSVDENLTIVTGILDPAEQLLGEIGDVAGSYENLSALLPPFTGLANGETSFADMESSLLVARYNILSAAKLANMTGEELLAALDAVNRFNSLVTSMNHTIDSMLVSAESIIALQVEGREPFTHNDLIPLIEQLRDLLRLLQIEIDTAVREGINWGKTNPFLLLWLDASVYHLGDTITGGGYLYFNGSFTSRNLVLIDKDGANYTSALTSSGRFSFQTPVPIDGSWLGWHTMQAWASTPDGLLRSRQVPFEIVLVPSSISLILSTDLVSPVETVKASIMLRASSGERLAGMQCNLSVDGVLSPFVTGADGTFADSWQGSELGYGIHRFQASFGGALPYAPSASSPRFVTVDIPTNVTVELFSDRLPRDYSIVGNGRLTANITSPLSGMEVTVSIDGIVVANLTTDASGEFSFSIPAEKLAYGSHILIAEFLHRESIWRYSKAEVAFTVISPTKAEYPFFPHIPGWGGMGLERAVSYLFFGSYAYLVWLLFLALLAIIVTVYRAKHRKTGMSGTVGESLEPIGEPEQAAEAAPGSGTPPVAPDPWAFGEAAPGSPNEQIVWYYQGLLTFLTRKRKVSLLKSMTHWEVARMLDALGFPRAQVRRVTLLFEKAFYSGAQMTENDSVEMSTALTYIVGSQGGGGRNA